MLTKTLKTISTISTIVTLFILSSSPTNAQEPITINPVVPFTTPQQAVDKLIPAVLAIGALACFAYIVYGAYKYITAGDNPANSAAARQTIINAFIGLILLAASYIIWLIVLNITGIS